MPLGVKNAFAQYEHQPKHAILSVDPGTLIYGAILFSVVMFMWLKGKGKDKDSPEVLSVKNFFILLLTGPALMTAFYLLMVKSPSHLDAGVVIFLAFGIQGALALWLMRRQDQNLDEEIDELQREDSRNIVSLPTIKFLLVAATVVGGMIIFSLIDFFFFGCHFTEMRPCPTFEILF